MMFLLLVLLILLFSYKNSISSRSSLHLVYFITIFYGQYTIRKWNGFFSSILYVLAGSFFRANPDSNFSYLADEVTVPYNEFLKMYVENGLIGFVLLGILVFNIFKIKNTLVCRKKICYAK